MKYLAYLFICLFMFSHSAMADEKNAVKDLVQEKINHALALLQTNGMDKKQRNDRIIETVSPLFDFEQMAKLSLGKKYWMETDMKNQEKYSSLFISRLQESYLEKLDLYNNETVVYEEAQEKNNKMHLMTHLVSKDNKIDMLYKLYKSKDGWKVYDLEIQGVSVVQTYRSQFDGVMKNGTIDDLLAKLRTSGNFALPNGNK